MEFHGCSIGPKYGGLLRNVEILEVSSWNSAAMGFTVVAQILMGRDVRDYLHEGPVVLPRVVSIRCPLVVLRFWEVDGKA